MENGKEEGCEFTSRIADQILSQVQITPRIKIAERRATIEAQAPFIAKLIENYLNAVLEVKQNKKLAPKEKLKLRYLRC
jgi:hypothetical protein